jgi:hypothetical protein
MYRQVLALAISEDGHAVSRIVGLQGSNNLQLSEECYKILQSLDGTLVTNH